MWSGEGGSRDGVGAPDELRHEVTPAGYDFVPGVEGWFGVSPSVASDAGCGIRVWKREVWAVIAIGLGVGIMFSCCIL